MQHVFLCIDFPEKMQDKDAEWLKKIREYWDGIAYIMAIQPVIDRAYLIALILFFESFLSYKSKKT